MWLFKNTFQLAHRSALPGFKYFLDRNAALSKTWKRPDTVQYPKVWRRWTGRQKVADSTPIHFKIQDVPEELFEGVIDHLTIGLRDEPMFRALKLFECPTSLRDMQDIWWEMLHQRVSLVALVDDPLYLKNGNGNGNGNSNGHAHGNGTHDKTVIAGCNIMGVVDKESLHHEPKMDGEKAKLFMKALAAVERKVDVFARYGVTHYLSGMGLAIDSEFRGLGIGTEMLRARLSMGTKLGIPLTVTLFSSPASHAIAHTVGMDILTDLPYDTFTINGRAPFPGAKGSMRLMGKRIE